MFPEVQYARILITLVRTRAAHARRTGHSDVGASAIEWAIISAIVVGLAIVIGIQIKKVVDSRVNEIGNGANG